jgi:DnaJ-domain-containing protein 1
MALNASSDVDQWRRQNSDPVAVEVGLVDGSLLKGQVLLQRNRALRDVFNAPEPFLDFDSFEHGPMVLAKAAIRCVRALSLPQADQLARGLDATDAMDPFQILGVSRGADRDTVRTAYIERARTYHPDRYVSMNLPREVLEYLNAMSRRINAAYAQLNPSAEPARRDPSA